MGRRLTSTDPATGETVASFPIAEPEDVEAAIERAREAQPDWADLDPSGRLAPLRRFQRLLLDRVDEVCALITHEVGKPLIESRMADVMPTLDMVKFLARHGEGALSAEPVRLGNPLLIDRSSRVEHVAHGVVGIIAPWNYPFSIPATQTLSALYAGNAVVLKPSELSPAVGALLAELLAEAGVPGGLVNVVQGPGDPTGRALAGSDVDLLVFTGSVPVGRTIAETRARALRPVVLELGGKDPMVVLEDANVQLAADGAAWGSFTNAGQTCASVERVYVHREVADEFVERVSKVAGGLRVGPGDRPGTEMGPLIRAEAVERCERQVADALDRGGLVATGGKRLDALGPLFFAPTVITRADASMEVMRDETFGPLLPIQVFDDVDEAVRLANDSPYGLTASVWTNDRALGERIARRLVAGTVTVNDAVYTYAACETPWGGTRDSGLGRTHGVWGLREMTRLAHINVARAGRARSPWYYPYDEDLTRLFDDGLEFLYGRRRRGARALGALKRRFF